MDERNYVLTLWTEDGKNETISVTQRIAQEIETYIKRSPNGNGSFGSVESGQYLHIDFGKIRLVNITPDVPRKVRAI